MFLGKAIIVHFLYLFLELAKKKDYLCVEVIYNGITESLIKAFKFYNCKIEF